MDSQISASSGAPRAPPTLNLHRRLKSQESRVKLVKLVKSQESAFSEPTDLTLHRIPAPVRAHCLTDHLPDPPPAMYMPGPPISPPPFLHARAWCQWASAVNRSFCTAALLVRVRIRPPCLSGFEVGRPRHRHRPESRDARITMPHERMIHPGPTWRQGRRPVPA